MKKLLEANTKAATQVQIDAVLKLDISKSKKMIQMFELGMEVKDIADIMTTAEGKLVRYNFVYNVVSNHCAMNGIATESQTKEGKKDLIIAALLAGKTNKEISIDLRTNYNYVFNTIKGYLKEQKIEDPRKSKGAVAEVVEDKTAAQ